MQVSCDDGNLLRYRCAHDPRTEWTTGDGGLRENKTGRCLQASRELRQDPFFSGIENVLLGATHQVQVLNKYG